MNVSMEGRRAVVVGAGEVGLRKARLLVAAGAEVMVVAPEIGKGIEEMLSEHKITLQRSSFEPACLKGAFLAFAATDDPEVNKRIAESARVNGILVNIADDPESGDFHVPAVIRRGSMVVSISTGGRCPGFSQALKRRLEGVLTEGMVFGLEVAASVRMRMIQESGTWTPKGAYQNLLTDAFFGACEARDTRKVDEILQESVGEGYTLQSLGLASFSGLEEERV